jgi:hypothetical protein
VLLVVSNIAIAYTSHQGGSVTHGQDYLTEHFELMMEDSGVDEVKQGLKCSSMKI